MDYNDILPDVCNLTRELELTHPRLWTLSLQKAMKKGENALIQILHINCLLAGFLIHNNLLLLPCPDLELLKSAGLMF